jgi:hypothetical protein
MEADLKPNGSSLQVQSITPLFQLQLPVVNSPLFDVASNARQFIVATAADPNGSHFIGVLLNWRAKLEGDQ